MSGTSSSYHVGMLVRAVTRSQARVQWQHAWKKGFTELATQTTRERDVPGTAVATRAYKSSPSPSRGDLSLYPTLREAQRGRLSDGFTVFLAFG